MFLSPSVVTFSRSIKSNKLTLAVINRAKSLGVVFIVVGAAFAELGFSNISKSPSKSVILNVVTVPKLTSMTFGLRSEFSGVELVINQRLA